MTFADLVAGDAVFLDANTLIYHFSQHGTFGPACTSLLRRIEQGELIAYTSSHVLGEVCHKLMILEACTVNNWPAAGSANRLKRHPAVVQALVGFRKALSTIPQSGIQVLTVPLPHMIVATSVSQQFGLLTNDAVIVVVMQANGLTNLASHDADFDRVPGLTRYTPV